MNFNTLPEEQDNPELINHLQDFHRLAPEDRASLASIERRLLAVAPPQLQGYAPAEASQSETIIINFPQPRAQKVWVRRLQWFAVVAWVILLLGASVPAFVLIQGKNHSAPGGKTTHATGTVSIPPGEKSTLVGNGTLVNAQIVFMATPQIGWARQGQSGAKNGPIVRTTDGGKHWQQVTLPQELSGQPFAVYAFDGNMAIIVPPAVEQTIPQSYLYRTLDGGATWQRGTLPALSPDDGGIVVLNWSFLDHQQGWMTMWRGICCGGDSRNVTLDQLGGETLYHTTDGGLTWLQFTSLSFKYPGKGITFITARLGWLTTYVDDPVHPSLSDPLAFPGALYVTHDGGYTWQQQSLPTLSQTTSKSDYQGLTFFSASKGYLFDRVSTSTGPDQQFLYVTQDGGNSWQVLGSAIPSHSYNLNVINDIYVFDDTTLFTLRNGQWVAASKPFPFMAATVKFFSPLAGLAQTYTGDIYQTSDGGQTWQKIGTLPV
ncbi:WD40/YVTN/BNR-like repeat-containing protein [Tengunoibacter tsumagoiensis]|uniref:Uncharacterized protein n=1 Tax=Tengunoibacter tsumagoiensis TaxID=2014871 RepID=A0A402A8C7_9CHLR|nr:YCF48-related protein [Tengunoibacter tsumagoiensis]GCE15407.1 hypothetical protein KTT_52660 [Tengunoibacter tsumagoiensis]